MAFFSKTNDDVTFFTSGVRLKNEKNSKIRYASNIPARASCIARNIIFRDLPIYHLQSQKKDPWVDDVDCPYLGMKVISIFLLLKSPIYEVRRENINKTWIRNKNKTSFEIINQITSKNWSLSVVLKKKSDP